MENKTGRYVFQNVEFLRFLFSLIIVYFHIFYSNILKFVKDTDSYSIYEMLKVNCSDGWLVVECFFIMAGFFLYRTYLKNKEQTFSNFLVKKIIRLWPPFAFSIIITIVLSLFFPTSTSIYTHIMNLLFLQCIGVTLDIRGIAWFVSPLFWGMLFYFYILKNFKIKYANLIIALCVYFSLVGIINHFHGNFGRETFNVFFSSALMRAFIGLGIGHFIGIFYENMKAYVDKYFTGGKTFILATFFEILCFTFLIRFFVFEKIDFDNKLIFLIAFSVLFFLFLIKKGFLSNILENKYFGFLGKYAYSIYVMQQIGFFGLSYFVWKHKWFVENVSLCITFSLMFCVILGVLTYYLIEKPFCKFLNKKANEIKSF